MSYKIARYGWLPDLPDQRDHLYAAPVEMLGVLPARVDLRPRVRRFTKVLKVRRGPAPVTRRCPNPANRPSAATPCWVWATTRPSNGLLFAIHGVPDGV
jgi:hypothetical protein